MSDELQHGDEYMSLVHHLTRHENLMNVCDKLGEMEKDAYGPYISTSP